MQQSMYRAILAGLAILVILIVLPHPLATNDGPVHLAFSHQILSSHQADLPLQHRTYLIQLKANPNLAVYLLMAGLMRISTPSVTESLIQILCLLGPLLAAYFAVGQINPKNAWLSIFVLPISFSQMFFLGLYNHCISTAVFFLVIGTYFWMCKSPSRLRALTLSGTIVLAFVCHAAGFIMSVMGIASLSGTAIVLSYRRSRNLRAALKEQRYAIGAMIAPFPLAGWFLSAGTKTAVAYGVSFHSRVWQFVRLQELDTNHPTIDRFAAATVSGVLLIGLAVAGERLIRREVTLPQERRDQALGAITGTLIAIAIMLAFPDKMGGGWTHFRRFEIYPFFWMILVLAFDTFTTKLAAVFLAGGTSAALVLMGSTVIRERIIREQMAPLATVDRLVGNHCTVLPIILESRPIGQYKERQWMFYEPFYEAASRLELTGDRVVLFNYLARLDAYPVHFHPSMEPQRLIFEWKPQQSDVWIDKVNIAGFEHESGLDVDYILLWGSYKSARPGMQNQVETALKSFNAIYASPDGSVKLYERQAPQNSSCTSLQVGTPGATAN